MTNDDLIQKLIAQRHFRCTCSSCGEGHTDHETDAIAKALVLARTHVSTKAAQAFATLTDLSRGDLLDLIELLADQAEVALDDTCARERAEWIGDAITDAIDGGGMECVADIEDAIGYDGPEVAEQVENAERMYLELTPGGYRWVCGCCGRPGGTMCPTCEREDHR